MKKKGVIVFADDELHNIEALIEVAKAEEYEVITCRNASAAAKLVAERQIDCLVIDVMMDPGPGFSTADPQKGGLAAIDAILKVRPRQSIVCLSVLSDQKEINRLKSQNVLFLRKAETSLRKAWQMIESKTTGRYSA